MGATYFILTLLSCGEFCENITNEDEEECCNIEFLNDWSSRIDLLYEQKFCNWNWKCNTVELSSVVVQTEVIISVQPSSLDEAAPHYLAEEQHENNGEIIYNQNQEILPSYYDKPPSYPSIEVQLPRYIEFENTEFTDLEL